MNVPVRHLISVRGPTVLKDPHRHELSALQNHAACSKLLGTMREDFDELTNCVRESKLPGFQEIIFSWQTDEGEKGFCELTVPATGLDLDNYAAIAKQNLEKVLSFVDADLARMNGELDEFADVEEDDEEPRDLGLQ